MKKIIVKFYINNINNTNISCGNDDEKIINIDQFSNTGKVLN